MLGHYFLSNPCIKVLNVVEVKFYLGQARKGQRGEERYTILFL
jgi:hypothetical protein